MCRDTQRKHGAAGWFHCNALLSPSQPTRPTRPGRSNRELKVAGTETTNGLTTASHNMFCHFLLKFRLRSGKSRNACSCGEIIEKGAVEPSYHERTLLISEIAIHHLAASQILSETQLAVLISPPISGSLICMCIYIYIIICIYCHCYYIYYDRYYHSYHYYCCYLLFIIVIINCFYYYYYYYYYCYYYYYL